MSLIVKPLSARRFVRLFAAASALSLGIATSVGAQTSGAPLATPAAKPVKPAATKANPNPGQAAAVSEVVVTAASHGNN